MRILAIDPGLRFTGWAILEYNKINNTIKYIDSGVISLNDTSKSESRFAKLYNIFSNIKSIIIQFKPLNCAIENTYVNINSKTSLMLCEARTSAIIACNEFNILCSEYQSKTVKKIVTGNGNADKESILTAIKMIIGKDINFSTAKMDESDAISIGIAHIYNVQFKEKYDKIYTIQ